MNKIVLLPEQVANQIAAGEVIERPANIVKELLENSLDAEATEVNVFFKNGGKEYICICDNGCGMNELDAEMCFKRHATSKLKSIDDLNHLTSFGFRGEALPSIASVSNVTLKTKAVNSDHGIELQLRGGFLEHKKPSSINSGSTFIIENLFFNVPARKKFLKSETTEAAHIVNWVRLYALAYPNVFFSLSDGNREIFTSPKCNTLTERVNEIWPRRDSKEWLTINTHDGNFAVNGLISKHGDAYNNSNEIFIFVNDRPVYNGFMMGVIRNVYKQFLPQKTYPAMFLFIKVNATDVDINVHPTKREVRFKNEILLKNFISNSLNTVLEKSAGTQKIFFNNPTNYSYERIESFKPITLPTNSAISCEPVDSALATQYLSNAKNTNTPIVSVAQEDDNTIAKTINNEVVNDNNNSYCNNWRFLAFFKKTFALFEIENKLICFDCIAAIERINYEKLCKSIESEILPLQTLLIPKTFQLSPISSDSLNQNLTFLNLNNLCKIRYIKENTFLLEAIPNFAYESDENIYLDKLIHTLENYGCNITKSSAKQFFVDLIKNFSPNINFDEQKLYALRKNLERCQNTITSPTGKKIWHEIM